MNHGFLQYFSLNCWRLTVSLKLIVIVFRSVNFFCCLFLSVFLWIHRKLNIGYELKQLSDKASDINVVWSCMLFLLALEHLILNWGSASSQDCLCIPVYVFSDLRVKTLITGCNIIHFNKTWCISKKYWICSFSSVSPLKAPRFVEILKKSVLSRRKRGKGGEGEKGGGGGRGLRAVNYNAKPAKKKADWVFSNISDS